MSYADPRRRNAVPDMPTVHTSVTSPSGVTAVVHGNKPLTPESTKLLGEVIDAAHAALAPHEPDAQADVIDEYLSGIMAKTAARKAEEDFDAELDVPSARPELDPPPSFVCLRGPWAGARHTPARGSTRDVQVGDGVYRFEPNALGGPAYSWVQGAKAK